MYAFGPLPRQKRSGRVIGTHQKIDRVARRHLKKHILEELPFPHIEDILHFEGSRGPDGIKMKSPGKDEPWHFVDPKDIQPETGLLIDIRNHKENLARALVNANIERAAFEAAWLAHAVTDGLTPAHHEPLHEQVKHMRPSGEREHKFRSRIIMTGNGSGRKFVKNNWEYWGAKGIMTSHTLFEAGVATTAKPLAFKTAALQTERIEELERRGFDAVYGDMIRAIDALRMYESFKNNGWTRTLARQTTQKLIPTIIEAVELAWYDAYNEALKRKKLV